MLAFRGKPALKEKYLNRLKSHHKADTIVRGIFWENGKGCAVGCTVEGGNHAKYPQVLGIPMEIAYLEDAIFEELSNGKAKDFAVQFLEAIPVGADLGLVFPQFVAWLLGDKEHGLVRFTRKKSSAKKAVLYAYDLFDAFATGTTILCGENGDVPADHKARLELLKDALVFSDEAVCCSEKERWAVEAAAHPVELYIGDGNHSSEVRMVECALFAEAHAALEDVSDIDTANAVMNRDHGSLVESMAAKLIELLQKAPVAVPA